MRTLAIVDLYKSASILPWDCIKMGDSSQYQKLQEIQVKAIDVAKYSIQANSVAALTYTAFSSIAFYYPTEQILGFSRILASEKSSNADRFVAKSLLDNATVASEGVLPICQDTGTACIHGWISPRIAESICTSNLIEGTKKAYREKRLRNSMLVPLDMYEEIIGQDNSPSSIDLQFGDDFADSSCLAFFCFSAKGGGSSNRTWFSMENPALLDSALLHEFLSRRVQSLGVAGCPPYRIAVVLGGTSPQECLRTMELATLGLLDNLDSKGKTPSLALRIPNIEEKVMEMAAASGFGAQFGGSAFALDARVIRLPRHAACLPIAIGVACSAHRKVGAIIRRDGVYLEKLASNFTVSNSPILDIHPPCNLPNICTLSLQYSPIKILEQLLTYYSVGDFFSLSGMVILARDAAHSRFRKLLQEGKALPNYLVEYPIFYAGPTDSAPGRVSGAFGPTTAMRMDPFLEMLLAKGASLVSIAKGERSQVGKEAIEAWGGAYFACLGGIAAYSGAFHVVSSTIIDYADLGMEAVRIVEIKDLPARLSILCKRLTN